MTLEEWIKFEELTPKNIDEYIDRNGRSWHGMASADFWYQCSPKGLELDRYKEESHAFYTWDEVRDRVYEQDQIRFEGF